MYLLPAIDILDGKAVRLAGGDYAKVTVYNDDPVLQAQLFEEAGAEWLHMVDLDGARDGDPANVEVVSAILRRTKLHVEVGGGIRTLDAARRLLDTGADRAIFGTALVRDPELAQAAVEEFGADAVVAGIDAKDGDVKVEGWVAAAEVTALELAAKMAALGYEHLVYTDIAMFQAFGNPVIASGGIASVADIQELAKVSQAIEGVIAGRAIYEGAFSVASGVAACKGTMVDEPDYLRDLEKPIRL